MNRRRRNFTLLVALAAAAIAPGSGRSAPAGAAIPDFGGVWDHPGLPGFEPLASGPTSLVNLSRREGNVSNNMQLVGDYKNPILKPQTAQTVKKFGDMSLAHIGYPTPRNQCWPGGVPFEFINNGLMMLQKPDEILVIYRGGPQVRHIRMNQSHPAKLTPSWYGDSVGHYEGDTLVVDTVGVKIGPFAMVDIFGTPHSEALHLIERYRLIGGEAASKAVPTSRTPFGNEIDPDTRKDGLQVEFTVEDKGTFTMPWSARVTYRPLLGEWQEVVCAENNGIYSSYDWGRILHADRPDF